MYHSLRGSVQANCLPEEGAEEADLNDTGEALKDGGGSVAGPGLDENVLLKNSMPESVNIDIAAENASAFFIADLIDMIEVMTALTCTTIAMTSASIASQTTSSKAFFND
ncbi:hypothetical protein C1752_03581 [Acaryochloris thomasi RCC1774]|uniref:Uncharacterized protein n=1 Tax=Acaryochloris thomasi RCC1774 TaxID=1764569 RepID=A0A2W1JG14_9CYAN|nr:hypothetical protein C1752_03581 [Acaryochloris thomasi RCC1774]